MPTVFKRVNRYFTTKTGSILLLVIGVLIGVAGVKAPALVQSLQNTQRVTTDTGSTPSLQDIRTQITADIPLLHSRQEKTEFEIINTLREWVFETVPVISYDGDFKIEQQQAVSSAVEISLGKRLQLFTTGQSGAQCSATASTLRDIYELFGFEAYVLHVGSIPERTATHSFVLVRIQDNGQNVLSVQNPHNNYAFADSDGQPLDFFEIVQLLQAKKHSGIQKLAGEEENRPRLFPAENITDDSETTQEAVVRYEPFEQPRFEQKVFEYVAASGYPEDFAYLLLFPYGIYGTDFEQSQQLLAKIQAVTGNWCSSADDTCQTFD